MGPKKGKKKNSANDDEQTSLVQISFSITTAYVTFKYFLIIVYLYMTKFNITNIIEIFVALNKYNKYI